MMKKDTELWNEQSVKIEALLKHCDLQSQQLAGEIGVVASTFSGWKTGQKNVDMVRFMTFLKTHDVETTEQRVMECTLGEFKSEILNQLTFPHEVDNTEKEKINSFTDIARVCSYFNRGQFNRFVNGFKGDYVYIEPYMDNSGKSYLYLPISVIKNDKNCAHFKLKIFNGDSDDGIFAVYENCFQITFIDTDRKRPLRVGLATEPLLYNREVSFLYGLFNATDASKVNSIYSSPFLIAQMNESFYDSCHPRAKKNIYGEMPDIDEIESSLFMKLDAAFEQIIHDDSEARKFGKIMVRGSESDRTQFHQTELVKSDSLKADLPKIVEKANESMHTTLAAT